MGVDSECTQRVDEWYEGKNGVGYIVEHNLKFLRFSSFVIFVLCLIEVVAYFLVASSGLVLVVNFVILYVVIWNLVCALNTPIPDFSD